MREIWITFVLVDCLVMLANLTFVKTTTIVTRTSFRRSLREKQSILPDDRELPVENNTGTLSQPPGGKRLRKKRRLSHTSFNERKDKVNASHDRFRKQSDNAIGQYKAGFSKRDFFFSPGSPYQQVISPVDRRFFLVHRGERGNYLCR